MVLLFSPSEIYKLKEFHFAVFDCLLGIFFSSSLELKCGQQVETAVAPATTIVVDVAAAEQQQQLNNDDDSSKGRQHVISTIKITIYQLNEQQQNKLN